jgi:hypothetical protein
MCNPFVHTHTVKIVASNGATIRIPVNAGERGLLENAVLYTREEWESAENADWEVREGELTFQGKPAAIGYPFAGGAIQLVENA